ncbi:secretion protein [Flavobacterium tistrianum]|uniref:secretion protein n=1 Tax=Flavobacterium tistrianum TaxID=1685414 RepID=UPI0013A65B17|nr:secretion protein [Flavobacterium tistrianum]KAF2343053.1 secretion protein [Flavobacterium tistrianum]
MGGVTYAANREGDCTLKIETGDGKAVSFTLNPAQETSVLIYDQQHNLIYESPIGRLDVLKTVRLGECPSGIYYMEVAGKEKTRKHKIRISKDLKKSRMEESVNYSPSLRR